MIKSLFLVNLVENVYAIGIVRTLILWLEKNNSKWIYSAQILEL
jgi:hypothetical protein